MTEQQDFRTLERAATIMIDQLPKQARDLVTELADLQYNIPRWHIVAGSMLRLFEEGRNTDYTTEPHWGHARHKPEPTKCKECGNEFMPKRLGQIFCVELCAQTNAGMLKEDTNATRDEFADVPPSDDSDHSPDSDLDGDTTNAPTLEDLLKQSAGRALTEIQAEVR